MKSKTKNTVIAKDEMPDPSISSISLARYPTHAEISVCASAIWEISGRPRGRDTAIWLEAERRLRTGAIVAGVSGGVFADTQSLLEDSEGSRSATSL
jgi:hypothetical protein